MRIESDVIDAIVGHDDKIVCERIGRYRIVRIAKPVEVAHAGRRITEAMGEVGQFQTQALVEQEV